MKQEQESLSTGATGTGKEVQAVKPTRPQEELLRTVCYTTNFISRNTLVRDFCLSYHVAYPPTRAV